KDVGSVFTVSFPQVGSAVTRVIEPPQPAQHLLVVDDNQNTRRLVARMLDREYRVTTAGTAQEALNQAEATPSQGVL
ncbi:MAG: response regulator, partial [Okeania sp. SIO2D1]|nr:response regulator [Okeania sp. SIO2D1]